MLLYLFIGRTELYHMKTIWMTDSNTMIGDGGNLLLWGGEDHEICVGYFNFYCGLFDWGGGWTRTLTAVSEPLIPICNIIIIQFETPTQFTNL